MKHDCSERKKKYDMCGDRKKEIGLQPWGNVQSFNTKSVPNRKSYTGVRKIWIIIR